ncbi:isocitrate lyase/phosphoenolpyruvate mutase family protein [Microbacterium sp. H1-D42]|uniref:isocitrate lyase/PEP mutase family protein n=1 Tax=Microbacterium sp. H1-D42 TaxID=2925844 RepID=UPI001F531D84|nr:isocitrate lyase/phosphoenolpyruvate mutase family protein [Microbacterium sp. H1-D42]UNK71489.1 isocitrate lyase/phosphoenolpyruvate mutase family protein [Microbacterium sp. H1-D42]
MLSDHADTLLALHRGEGFVIPNAWDAGSARILAQAGFPAIATTSAGIAWSHGLPDGGRLSAERMLEHIGEIVAAVDVPVSADLEDGFGDSPDAVARTVGLAMQLGAVGANIEDVAGGRLIDVELAVDKLVAVREAAPRGAFVINARTDPYFASRSAVDDPFAETVSRALRYVDAGADCVFIPGVDDADSIRRLASEIPVPINIVAGLTPTRIDAPMLFSLGVARVSIGGALARAALAFVDRAGRELRETGTLGFLDEAMAYADVQRRFG